MNSDMEHGKDKPLLAIRCVTYNHEPYIRDCLEGFVMQKTNFKFVAIVHDDASTDNTAIIVKEYAERYPDIIKPILQKENQHSKGPGTIGKILNEAIDNTEAKYVALCEGDDYWIDPYKLQKQVDFMEANPDYSLCFTNTKVMSSERESIAIKNIWDTYLIEDLINNNALNSKERGDLIVSCGHTSTLLYRKPIQKAPVWISQCFIGDEPLFIYLAQFGKAKFINEMTSLYRAGVGISSRNFDFVRDWKNRIEMYRIINNGLNYKYANLINPIIAEFNYKISKLLWKNGKMIKSFVYLYKSITSDTKIIFKKIKRKQ